MYYYDDRPGCDDAFGSLMTVLVIFGILIAVAFYIGFYILLIFLGIGVVIGSVYALIAYIKAFINAVRTLSGVHARNGFLSFLLRWWVLFKNASIFALKDNFTVAHNAIINAGNYKFLSFKKWMWLIVAPTVLIFGTGMILAFAFLQLGLVAAIVMIIFYLFIAIALVYLVITLGYAIVKICAGTVDSLKNYNPFSAVDFSRYFTFSDIGRFSGEYFRNLFSAIKQLWQDSISLITYNFSSSKGYPVINVVRYFLMVSPIAIFTMMCVSIAIVFVILSIVYVPLLLAELVWALITKIFVK